jgi:adenylate cyclase
MKSEQDRKLTTILCADVAGYSRLMSANEEKTLARLKETRVVFRALIEENNGRIVNMTGDGLVADFSSAVKAMQCAIEIQNKLNKENAVLPEPAQMFYRIGLNLGDVIIEGDDIFGEGVNVAARLETMAPIGGICISGPLFDQVKNKFPMAFNFLGKKVVKNIAEPVAVYSLSLNDAANSQKQPHTSKDDETANSATEEEDIRLRRMIKKQAAFYRLAMIYGSITVFLFVINAATSSDYWWFFWAAGPMALVLAMRAISVFGKGPVGQDWEERKFSELKEKNRNDPN